MKNIWDKRINGIPLIMLIIISIFLIYVASATGIEILFSNAGRGYTSLPFPFAILWFVFEASFYEYMLAIISLWVNRLPNWLILILQALFLLVFTMYQFYGGASVYGVLILVWISILYCMYCIMDVS